MSYLIHQMIDRVASKVPDREAVRIYGQKLTYSELSIRSSKLAHTLIDQGVKRRDRVGIYLNKSLETAVAVYGIMKAGAAYVPLDPSAPLDRISFMIKDCSIQHIITQNSKVVVLKELIKKETELDCIIGIQGEDSLPVNYITWGEVNNSANQDTPDIQILEQDLAYIIYTSGSTGIPKGIMHTHHSCLSFCNWAVKAYNIRPEDRVSNQAPLHFDMSIFDLFASAVAGATTIIIPDEYMRMPASYSKLLSDEKISIFFTVPFALSQLFLRGVIPQRDLSAIRWIIFGGDTHSPTHIRGLMEMLPGVHFSNMYGPAETNGCTYFNFDSLPEDDDTAIPIGKACENMETLVVNVNDQPITNGVGELFVRTPSMMQGYWNRPLLNDKAFYTRKIFESYREVYYRTGDLVEITTSGNLKFSGRKDRQVKIRGYRVELEELETLLTTHLAIEEAAAFPVEKEEQAKSIEAAITVVENMEADTSEITSFLKEKLPPYAIPDRINIVEDFPRTGTGKINRLELQLQASEKLED